jgi:hypothetical protein
MFVARTTPVVATVLLFLVVREASFLRLKDGRTIKALVVGVAFGGADHRRGRR